MARKSKSAIEELTEDTLEGVETFDPEKQKSQTAAKNIPSSPLSPLGTAPDARGTELQPVEVVLLEANNRIKQLQTDLAKERDRRRDLEAEHYKLEGLAAQTEQIRAELDQERDVRRELEHENTVIETQLKHSKELLESLEGEREARLELERRIGSLEIRAKATQDLEEEVAEARIIRIELERDKATLEIEVEHAKKLETMLAEERQSRASAQMRASTAEAKLAQVEGELAARDKKGRGLFGLFGG